MSGFFKQVSGSRRSDQRLRRSGQGSRWSDRARGHGGRARGHDGRVGGHGGRIRDSQVTTVGIGGPYAGEGVALFASPHRRHRRRHGTSSCLTNHGIVHTCVHLSVIGDVTASSVLYNYYTTAFMKYSNCKHLFRQCDPVEYFCIDQRFTLYCALYYEC